MGYWALKGWEVLAGRYAQGEAKRGRCTPKPVMRTLISCSGCCAASEANVSAEPEELALLSPMAVVVYGFVGAGCALGGCVGDGFEYYLNTLTKP